MPREIVVNGRFLSRRVTGVERYGREILQRFTGEYRVIRVHRNRLAGHAWEQFILPLRMKRDSVLWSPANFGPLAIRDQALTLHDLGPLEHPEWFSRKFAAWHRLILPTLAKRVRLIFTPSEYIKQRVAARFGVANVKVTPNGVDPVEFHPDAPKPGFMLPDKYILFVGSRQPRKNLTGLTRAWHQIKDGFRDTWLLIAGGTEHVFQPIDLGEGERTLILDYVNDLDLPGLYANAALFVFPSLDEGFGLPAIEAMACGTPVIVSNGGALPEVIGDAGLIFDLAQPDTLMHAMQLCLSDKKLRTSLVEKGMERAKHYSWEKTADLVWSALNEL